MSRQRRGFLTVDPAGKAGLYQHQPLPGWQVLGTVSTEEGTGALVLNTRTCIYCQANASVLRSLPQNKVAAAIAAKRLTENA